MGNFGVESFKQSDVALVLTTKLKRNKRKYPETQKAKMALRKKTRKNAQEPKTLNET